MIAYIAFLIPYLGSALISLAVAVYAYRHRSVSGGSYLALLALLETIWTAGYMAQRVSSTLQGMIFWNSVQFIGAVGAPLVFLVFCTEFSGRKARHPRLTWGLASVTPLLILIVVWTDPWTGLFRGAAYIAPGYPLPQLVFGDGIALWTYPIYAYPTMLLGTYFLAANFFTAPRIYRFQIATVLLGIMIPWLTMTVTLLELVPYQLQDITPLSFAASNIILAWALFRYRLFDIVPVARDYLVENMRDGVIVLDNQMRVIDFNPAVQNAFSLSKSSMIGKDLSKVVPELGGVLAAHRALALDPLEIELEADGAFQRRLYEVRFTRLLDNRTTQIGQILLLRDITEQKNIQEKLQQLAITDPLTGLFNRRHFFDLASHEFKRSVRYGHPQSILILDVDHFKTINDTHGHAAGDDVLQNLAQKCGEQLRSFDVMARYGGDEFILMLPETEADKASQTAERLRQVIESRPLETDSGLQLYVTISFGIATLNASEGISLDELIDRADTALYIAKNSGRNQIRAWEEKVG
ncbi:MAG: diguanylate cyclase [Anaerolineaceae bacterium]|nr:diguanylate cyclase [Anaerolineaceae bacterium]